MSLYCILDYTNGFAVSNYSHQPPEYGGAIPAFTLRPRSQTKPVKTWKVDTAAPSEPALANEQKICFHGPPGILFEGRGPGRLPRIFQILSVKTEGTDQATKGPTWTNQAGSTDKSKGILSDHMDVARPLRLNGNKRPNMGQSQAKQAFK